MTVKEIATLCGVTEQTIVNWVSETSQNFRDVLNQKIKNAHQTKKPADFTLYETLTIIGDGGKNKALAALLADNAENKNAVIVQPSNTAIAAQLLEKFTEISEQNKKIIELNENHTKLHRLLTAHNPDPHDKELAVSNFIKQYIYADGNLLLREKKEDVWARYKESSNYFIKQRDFIDLFLRLLPFCTLESLYNGYSRQLYFTGIKLKKSRDNFFA